MEKSVYKITNNINNKVYIGQSNNVERRFREHIGTSSFTSLIHRAILKYGVENFSLEVLYIGEDYNNQEKYFIAKYNSIEEGYNILPGGQDPPRLCGEESNFCLYDSNVILEIISLLQNTSLEYSEIATEIGCSKSMIYRINKGLLRKLKNTSYPIRKTKLDLAEIKKIKWYLLNTDFHREELVEIFKYEWKISTFKAINSGQNHKDETLNYPLRSKVIYGLLNPYDKIHPIKKLLSANFPIEKILSKYKISRLRLEYINEGLIYFEEGISYPINLNLEPVETRALIGS
jgi:group I intron endonuclease